LRSLGYEHATKAGVSICMDHMVIPDAKHVLLSDAQEEVLGRFDDGARLRVLEQVAVVQGAQAEVLELHVALGHDCVVELAGVCVNKSSEAVVDDTQREAGGNRLGEGVDLLVHEVASPETFQRAGASPERAKSIVAHHVTPEQAGEVFSRTKPKLAVYSHIVLPTATEQDLIPPTRKTYSGPLELGEDLMVIAVGEKVEVRRPSRSSP